MPKGKYTRSESELKFAKSARTIGKIIRLANDLTAEDREYLVAKLSAPPVQEQGAENATFPQE